MQDHRELIAPDAGDGVGFADLAADSGRQCLEKLVARGMDPTGVYAPWQQMLEADIIWAEGEREAAIAKAEQAAATYAARGAGWRAWQDHVARWLAEHPRDSR